MEFTTSIFFVNIIFFLLGLIILVKGSDWFVEAAAFIARHYEVSEVIIGLTLVSLGTSLPELATNLYAVSTGDGDIALGTIVGSNITNISLVLALGVVLMGKIPVSKNMLKRDGLVMLAVIFLYIILAYTPGKVNILSRIDGVILLCVCIVYVLLLFYKRKDSSGKQESGEPSDSSKKIASMKGASLFFSIGLIGIFFGAKLMVDNIVQIATDINIPKDIIAATVVAFGTSVPELAVTVTGVMKKQNDLALGNIIGSCIFNIALVLGATALIAPLHISDKMLSINILMPLTAVLLFLFMLRGRQLRRSEGVILLLIYAIFVGYSIWAI